MRADVAKHVLETAVEWGRYGEVYEYDFHTGRLKLPDSDDDEYAAFRDVLNDILSCLHDPRRHDGIILTRA